MAAARELALAGQAAPSAERNLAATVVTYAVHSGALGCLAYLAVRYPIHPLFTWQALFWLALSLVTSYSEVPIYSTGTPNSVSAGFTVHAAILAIFSPLSAVVLVMIGTLTERDFKRLRRLDWTLYNRSMHGLAASASALVFAETAALPIASPIGALIARMGALVGTYFVVNTVLVRVRIAALDREPFFSRYPFKGDLLVGYLLQGFVAVLLVLFAVGNEALAIVILGPLFGVKFSLQKIIELRELNEQLVQSFADALDMRDRETAGHTRRVATVARFIGMKLGLSRRELNDIYAAGSLHDLGKIGIPDSILLKPGALDRHEWEEMKKHPVLGAGLLAPYRHLRNVTSIMRHHHERWDGRGYPDGLSGQDIPIGARVIAVADTFIVICDGRQYRPARSIGEAIAEIERCSGSQFDPAVVEAFLALDPADVLATVDAMDIRDPRPVLRALAPGPIWSRLIGFKAA
jgi:hypothetical protein